MAYIDMVHIVMAYMIMVYMIMAYISMARIVIWPARCLHTDLIFQADVPPPNLSFGGSHLVAVVKELWPHSYGLCRYGSGERVLHT